MRRVYSGILVLALAAFGVPALQADVIVPGAVAGIEGNSNNAFPFNIGVGSSQRYQQVYSSSEFASTVLISGISFRPDTTFGSAFATTTLTNILITLSTTSAAVDGLSSTFANNVGANVTTVFSGAVALSSAFTGPAGGPKDFDISIMFSAPFLYNPLQGNLLLDVKNVGGGTTRQFDAQAASLDSISRVFSNCNLTCSGVNDLTGLTATDGLVTEFKTATSAVPEPSSLLLLAAGLGALFIVPIRSRF